MFTWNIAPFGDPEAEVMTSDKLLADVKTLFAVADDVPGVELDTPIAEHPVTAVAPILTVAVNEPAVV